jgi:hypothetical protein
MPRSRRLCDYPCRHRPYRSPQLGAAVEVHFELHLPAPARF